nr:MAG TPA: hypothetical protein [Bacteriophage sp.]
MIVAYKFFKLLGSKIQSAAYLFYRDVQRLREINKL